VISENFELDIKFDNNINTKNNSLNLPEITDLKNSQDFTNLRAFADSEALKIKYKNKKIFLENEPAGSTAKTLYAIAEKIRYQKIGADKLKGVKNNILRCYENKFKDKKISEIKTEADVPIAEAFELYLMKHFFDIKQNATTKKILSYWQKLFDKNLQNKLKELDNCIKNQSQFNHIMAELINSLEFEDTNSKQKEEETQDDSPSENNSKEASQNQKAEESSKEEAALSASEENTISLSDNDNLNQSETKEIEGDPNSQKVTKKNVIKETYKIYTNEFDEIKEAINLEKEDEIIRLRKNLDQQLTNLQKIIL
jgi:cobaltochelatase CobT